MYVSLWFEKTKYDYGNLFAIFSCICVVVNWMMFCIVKALVYMDSSTYLDQMKVMVDNWSKLLSWNHLIM